MAVASTLGLPSAAAKAMAAALAEGRRPSVIWLHLQGCSGCTKALMQGVDPSFEELILDLLSLDYHELLMACAGADAERLRRGAQTGDFILVVEGAVPLGMPDALRIGDVKGEEVLRDLASRARLVVAIGSCASWGGMPSSAPNPTGAAPVSSAIGRHVDISLPGCPPNPQNVLAALVPYLAHGILPERDALGRPLFAYGRTVHEQCERFEHFRAGRFAKQFGDEGHRRGWCLYEMGCKGPVTHANCPKVRFNQVDTWPVACGHPCIGCTEKGVAFEKSIAAKVPARGGRGRRQ